MALHVEISTNNVSNDKDNNHRQLNPEINSSQNNSVLNDLDNNVHSSNEIDNFPDAIEEVINSRNNLESEHTVLEDEIGSNRSEAEASIYSHYSDHFLGSDDERLSTSDSDSETDIPINNFDNFDEIMFHESNMKVRDIILICTAFSLRFNVPDDGYLMLADIMKLCAGPNFQNLNLSKYMMSKCFSSQHDKVTYHYYCTHCFNKIILSVNATEKQSQYREVCEECEIQTIITSASQNYFVNVDLAYQLEILFSNESIVTHVLKNIQEGEATSHMFQGSIKKVF